MFKRNHVARVLISALIVTIVNTVHADAAPVDAFQVTRNGMMAAGTEGLNLSFTVPTGKQLVIEYVAGNCFVPTGQTCVLSIFTEVGKQPRDGSQFQQNSGTRATGPSKGMISPGPWALLGSTRVMCPIGAKGYQLINLTQLRLCFSVLNF